MDSNNRNQVDNNQNKENSNEPVYSKENRDPKASYMDQVRFSTD